ncbi:MAG TPA: electron transport complex subunit RsxD [Gammaproteobacteria bacterium]|jgi:electron transport complex protein RnfD|nr:RnfABCDGE type electron transport complex subunit D [Gammaproteobacteria bacterium]MDP6732972.1 RnfABCDGE type electron transport complex subunit D [Gammaproteobacteria bacterium]HAJ76331.1 electron transport complex subunit RsxD [Gammaproteobacteria bacterium]
MSVAITSSPMQHGQLETNRLMLLVIAACLPGVGIGTWFFGYGIIINITLAALAALVLEAMLLTLRKRELKFYLGDNSALVTAMLFGITMPPGSIWWMVLAGIAFAIVIGKHAYGGLGQNAFNPAMCGYLFLLLSFPLEMTSWHIPSDTLVEGASFSPLGWQGLQQSLLLSFPFLAADETTVQLTIDGLTMATPLIEFKMSAQNALLAAWETELPLFARSSGTGWELVNIGYLLGGLLLLYKRIISWHIPASIIGTITLLSLLMYAPGSTAIYGTTYLHLFGSATMICAFFIATDPVSAATSNLGRIVYGIIIGISIYAIRVWGSYLDSIAIAVLFGNFCAPLLDHYLRPRVYGRQKASLPGGKRRTG